MKRTTTFLCALALLLLLNTNLIAQTTYPVYLCGSSTTVTLTPGITVNTGDEVVWVRVTGTTTSVVQSSTSDRNYTTPAAGLATGEHTYRVHVISASPALCIGDVSDDYKIYQLPPFAVALSTPTDYCENATATSITATATPAASATLPDDVSFAYTWEAKQGTTTLPIGDVGTNTANQNVFNMSTTVVGDYILTATADYVVPSGSVLKSAASCAVTSAAETIKVLPKPTKPTITIL